MTFLYRAHQTLSTGEGPHKLAYKCFCTKVRTADAETQTDQADPADQANLSSRQRPI